MEVRKTGTVGVDPEHRTTALSAATVRCPIQGVTGQNHSLRKFSVAVGVRESNRVLIDRCELVNVREASTIRVNREYRTAAARNAAATRRSVQSIAGQD